MDLARFGAWVQTKLDSLRKKPLTIGGIFGGAVTLAAFVVVTFYPVMRAQRLGWASGADLWTAFKVGWLPLLAALYIKYGENFKRAKKDNKLERRRRVGRQLMTGAALKDLNSWLQPATVPPDRLPLVNQVRERILEGAANGVASLLRLPEDARVVASLLEFVAPDLLKMRVISRSTRERALQVEYRREEVVAWSAIHDARIVVVDDVTKDSRWASVGKRNYRAIVALPVSFGGKAYGALSLDCDIPYAFYGRATDLAVQLEPYVATLALTYGKDALYHACAYEPPHH